MPPILPARRSSARAFTCFLCSRSAGDEHNLLKTDRCILPRLNLRHSSIFLAVDRPLLSGRASELCPRNVPGEKRIQIQLRPEAAWSARAIARRTVVSWLVEESLTSRTMKNATSGNWWRFLFSGENHAVVVIAWYRSHFRRSRGAMP